MNQLATHATPTPVATAAHIRPSTPADEPAIVELLREVGLRPNIQSHELYWKYWQERSDWPGSRSFVLTQAGRLLAHAAIIPGAFVAQERRVRVIHMIDWAARSSAPVAGVSLMKHVGRLTDVLLAIGGSTQTLRILPHIGFKQHGVVTGYSRPLHPMRVLTSRVGSLWRIPPRFFRSAYWMMTVPRNEFPGWSARRVRPTETAGLAAALTRRSGDVVSFERSEDSFNYLLACPIAAMELYAVEQSGRLRGYFMLAHAPGQTRIVDSWLDNDATADWCALFQCAAREASRNPDVAELVAWASDALQARALEDSGFHSRLERPVQMLHGKGLAPPKVTLRVQMVDSDAAFHHSGHPAHWA